MIPAHGRVASGVLGLVSAVGWVSEALSAPAAEPVGMAQPAEGLDYAAPFFPGARYDARVPTPDTCLGAPLGDRPASHGAIEACIRAWADASPRAHLVEYARSHEGRALYYVVVTAPSRTRPGTDPFAALKADLGRLADPRALSTTEGDALARTLPAVAWMAYAIHGDECSAADGALAVLYHLTAAEDPAVTKLLEDLVVIVDPLMNPDGRERYLKQLAEHRGTLRNADDQSLAHLGHWPWGRTNHYLFDLNRDWILGVHPETRGRIRAIGQWHPTLLIEGHEMWSQDTFLFSPPREPINPNLSPAHRAWWQVFARDHAAAFDAHGWRYYTGEWNEEWYPGYTSSWAGFRGAVGILYEQAGVGPDAVARPDGTRLTYRESVHHQVVSTMANLATLGAHRQELVEHFVESRRRAARGDGPGGSRVFAVIPSANRSRDAAFLDLMVLQGFEVLVAREPFEAPGTSRFGEHRKRAFPAGTVLVPNRQPLGALVAAMLEFDPHMPGAFLEEERRELLRVGKSRLYDVTAWSLPLIHDVDAWELAAMPAADTAPWPGSEVRLGVDRSDARVAWIIDGADDRSVVAAARLMKQGVQVRVAERPFRVETRDFPRGSVVVARDDNRGNDVLARTVRDVCTEAGVLAVGVDSGHGVGADVPDLGGGYFVRVERPRIAVLSQWPYSAYSFGETWFLIDQRLGIEAAYLDAGHTSDVDLRRYNVLVAPHSWRANPLGDFKKRIDEWVRGGGTFIAIGDAAAEVAQEKGGLGAARRLEETFDDPHRYELAVLREWEGRTATVDEAAVWSRELTSAVRYPWEDRKSEKDQGKDQAKESRKDEEKEGAGDKGKVGAAKDEGARPSDAKERKRRDEWQRVFTPQGALVAARTDDRHWLTYGTRDVLPVLVGKGPVLVSAPPVEAPVRLGRFVAAGKAPAARGGWAPVPPGHRLLMRLSGLLWPEAAWRLASSAYLTRESLGRGQVILFAHNPNFRAATLGTVRLFLNAVVYGPGLGASTPIRPITE